MQNIQLQDINYSLEIYHYTWKLEEQHKQIGKQWM